jgi:hypothetical protein
VKEEGGHCRADVGPRRGRAQEETGRGRDRDDEDDEDDGERNWKHARRAQGGAGSDTDSTRASALAPAYNAIETFHGASGDGRRGGGGGGGGGYRGGGGRGRPHMPNAGPGPLPLLSTGGFGAAPPLLSLGPTRPFFPPMGYGRVRDTGVRLCPRRALTTTTGGCVHRCLPLCGTLPWPRWPWTRGCMPAAHRCRAMQTLPTALVRPAVRTRCTWTGGARVVAVANPGVGGHSNDAGWVRRRHGHGHGHAGPMGAGGWWASGRRWAVWSRPARSLAAARG